MMKGLGFVRKTVVLSLLCLTSACFMGGCSSFLGTDGYNIERTSYYYDEVKGEVIVTLYFTDETVSPLVITIPQGIAGDDGVGIASVSGVQSDDGLSTIVTIKYTDASYPDTVLTIPNGKAGKGISEVSVTKDAKGNTVIVFTYTDGTYSDDIVIPKGQDGVGIASITTAPSEDGNSIVVTIKFTDSSIPDTVFNIDNPVGIESIVYDPTHSTKDSYALKVTYSNGDTDTIYVPVPETTIWLTGETAPSETDGENGDFYLNKVTGYVYQKVSGSWVFVLSMKGTGSSVDYLVTFNANGGAITTSGGDVSSVQFIIGYGEYISLAKIPTPTYASHTFAGWWTTADANPNAGHFTDLTPVFSDMYLYARWN